MATIADRERWIEEAADELGRLDAIATFAPSAVGVALRCRAILDLAALESAAGPRLDLDCVAAAEGDPLHDALLPPAALHWRTLIETEEHRVRSGAALASQRFAIVAPAFTTYTERPRLEAIWRESDGARPVLARALDAAAWCPTHALGDASAALMLCAGGRADRVRLLPFADVAGEARDDAIIAWRADDPDPWTRLGLAAASRRGRALRIAIERLLAALPGESAALDDLGRAAITARRALALLRERFVTSMPTLAAELGLSRPAANDALERLTAAGVAREVTGRGRDRVYAWAAACVVANAPVS